jgi:hypothetical protein
MAVSNLHVRDAERGRSLSDYWPLISLIVVSALAAFTIAAGSGKVTMTSVMQAYMGVFLVFFALLKIFDLDGERLSDVRSNRQAQVRLRHQLAEYMKPGL